MIKRRDWRHGRHAKVTYKTIKHTRINPIRVQEVEISVPLGVPIKLEEVVE